jgi:hypothetical protein
MEPFKLYTSTRSDKKYDVYVPHGEKLKKVSYGAKGYEDYTMHHDKDRRKNYRARHAGDNINDPYSAGFWSWYHLWGDSSNSSEAFKNAVRIAKKLI